MMMTVVTLMMPNYSESVMIVVLYQQPTQA